MYKVKKTKKEEKVAKIVTFKASDYACIRMKDSGREYVEHRMLADKLIKKGVAEEVKGVELVSASKEEAKALENRAKTASGETK